MYMCHHVCVLNNIIGVTVICCRVCALNNILGGIVHVTKCTPACNTNSTSYSASTSAIRRITIDEKIVAATTIWVKNRGFCSKIKDKNQKILWRKNLDFLLRLSLLLLFFVYSDSPKTYTLPCTCAIMYAF